MDNLRFISTWLPTINTAERQTVTHWLKTFPVDQVTAEFTRYLLASPHAGYWDPTVLMGGICCFYAGIGLYMASGSTEPLGSRVEPLFALTSLYMLIDSYLDDAATPTADKRQLIRRLLHGLDDPTQITSGSSNSLYDRICQHIMTLRSSTPVAIPSLKRLVQLEVQSTMIQSQPNLDLTVYRQIAEAKGGATVQAMEALLGLPITPEGYELGVCFQLVDDLYDTRIDQVDGIMTISTFMYQRDGHADALLNEVIGRIHHLPGRFNIFKIGLLFMLMACVATEPIFSSTVVTYCQSYLPVEPNLQFGQSLYHRLKGHHDQLKLGLVSPAGET
jgi:hypothetical protein